MKNKLLVFAFAVAVVVFGFTSCENKPTANVQDVCGDMIQETLHKSARGLSEQEGQVLTISEYDFLGGVKDNRLVYRTLTFGNGVFKAKTVDSLTYEYGEWNENRTTYTLLVTPRTGDPYTLVYQSNTFIAPDGRVYGGDGTANTARVEKWENVINTFPNTKWEGIFEDEYVLDSILEDSIRTTLLPPTFIPVIDTIKIWKGKLDTVNADTMSYCRVDFDRNASMANTGHYYKRTVRSKYSKKTQTVDTVSVKEKEYDFTWHFSEVSSDSRFVVVLKSTTAGVTGDTLSISKYKLDDAGKAHEFMQGGVQFLYPAVP